MELLAPAGNLENFHAAIDAGADALYVGAPGLNARNISKELSLETIAWMIEKAHSLDKKIFIALNSLIREKDLKDLIKSLAFFHTVQPDAFIVQDLAITRILHHFFPEVTLHASTLFGCHNIESVEFCESLSFSRVVVGRELTLDEICFLTQKSKLEIEVFIHGAMCYSYSGLCLFSSSQGGMSGLRGNCVQPCRRKYTLSGRSGQKKHQTSGAGYYFSMDDLSGLDFVNELKIGGVKSLKVEGRLRSRAYVYNVIKAYRTVIDSNQNDLQEAIDAAREMLLSAMGRKSSTGFFHHASYDSLISRSHSGNTGIHLGKANSLKSTGSRHILRIRLKSDCRVGDRVRVHFEGSGNRESFTLRTMMINEKTVDHGQAGEFVEVHLSSDSGEFSRKGTIHLYKVDSADNQGHNVSVKKAVRNLSKPEWHQIEKDSRYITARCIPAPVKQDQTPSQSIKRGRGRRAAKNKQSQIWLKIDQPEPIFGKPVFVPERYLITMSKVTLSAAGQIKKYLGQNMRSVVWALPMVSHDRDMVLLKKRIRILLRSGYRSFQIAHLSQHILFENDSVRLFGDYSLNLLNSQALMMTAEMGLQGTQLAIETDKNNLLTTLEHFKLLQKQKNDYQGRIDPSFQLGITVFGSPPLFVSRAGADRKIKNKTVVSPKGESFSVENREGITLTRSTRPFSTLPYLGEMQAMGLSYFIIDMTGRKTTNKELKELKERLVGKTKLGKLPTFNYLGTLK
ncbi:MAG: U32 family peptidase [Desulfobulbaceae bacterium]|nr:MAG: U32 family peptidase [Desulfobulbaceae bacterium]